jgi:hypothetical protein
MLRRSSPILATAAAQTFLARGCVNVIEFDGLMEEAGVRWSRMRDGVHARLDALLHAKLGPNDLFVPIGETAYLVTMPTTEADDVNAICTRIAFDLHTSFLGQCCLTQLHVNTVSCEDDNSLVLKRLPPDQIVMIAEQLGIFDQLKTQSADLGFGAVALERIRSSSSGVSVGDMIMDSPLDIECHYIPIWSVPNLAITTYACETKGIHIPSRSQPIPLSQLSEKERIQVELLTLQSGVAQLLKSVSNGERFLLVAPISFEVFGAPAGRMAILAVCKELPYDLRQYLSFVIYDVPPGVAQTRLANMANALRSVSRSVSATLSPGTRAYASYQGIGLRAIGFDLREFTSQNHFQQNDIEQLAQFARRSNLGTFLSGVKDKAALKYAQDAGIQLLSGPVIAPPCAVPQGMCRLTWAETLSKPGTELWV